MMPRIEEMAGNVALRTELEKATTLTDGKQYRAEIERLRRVYGHNIRVLPHDYGRMWRGEPEPSCYGFALGLADNAQYLQLVKVKALQGEPQPLSAASVTMLSDAGALRHRRAAPRNGDAVLYLNDREVKHAGVIIDAPGRIRSKWGQAEVQEHDLWEVPLNYGNVAETYLRPSVTRILEVIGDLQRPLLWRPFWSFRDPIQKSCLAGGTATTDTSAWQSARIP